MATVPDDLLNVSVSHGTLRSIDLYESFIGVLERVDPDSAEEFKLKWKDDIFTVEDGQNTIGGSEMMVALFDLMDSLAPEGFHFGSIEGDGSDFGFWGEAADEDDGCLTCEQAGRKYDPDRHDSVNCWVES